MKRPGGFVLLEVMLAVGIFSMGVIALGYCVNNCVTAESARIEDQRARLALENRMAEIELGSVVVDETKKTELKGQFAGMTLTQSRKALPLKNEKKESLENLFVVTLEAAWKSGAQPQSKTLSFYMYGQR